MPHHFATEQDRPPMKQNASQRAQLISDRIQQVPAVARSEMELHVEVVIWASPINKDGSSAPDQVGNRFYGGIGEPSSGIFFYGRF